MARWFDMVRLDAGSFFIAIYRCFPFYYHYFPSFQLATSFHSRNHAVEPCAPSEGPRPSRSGGIDMRRQQHLRHLSSRGVRIPEEVAVYQHPRIVAQLFGIDSQQRDVFGVVRLGPPPASRQRAQR